MIRVNANRPDHALGDRGHNDDSAGGATQHLQDGSLAPFPSLGISGISLVAGQRLACLTAAVQFLHHLGYDPDRKDYLDMRLLAERFGIDLPEPYRGNAA